MSTLHRHWPEPPAHMRGDRSTLGLARTLVRRAAWALAAVLVLAVAFLAAVFMSLKGEL